MDGVIEFQQTELYKSVLNWLKCIFGDDPIPQFHRDEQFIEYLHGMMMDERRLEQSSLAYADFVTNSIREYETDLASKMSAINELGLSDSVTSPIVECSNLAAISSSLSLSTFDEASFVLPLTDIAMSRDKTTSEMNTLKKTLDNGSNELAAEIQLNNRLESLMATVTEQQGAERATLTSLRREATFLRNKVAKYKADRKKQEAILANSGVTQATTHERLLVDHEQLKNLTAKLDSVREDLDKFAHLPPDKDLAQVKLEVARSELEDIEGQLAKQIDLFHI